MAYTVKQVRELSGVTVRALHFYEEIDLLKPAYHGVNGYRYYEEEQLLQLQQILFFKKLGFSLTQIQKVLRKKSFDKLGALHSHRRALFQERERIDILLQTIDKTIQHLSGEEKMKEEEMFNGLQVSLITPSQGKSYSCAEALVLQNLQIPTKKVSQEEIIEGAHKIFRVLVGLMSEGYGYSSKEVQQVIAKHHEASQTFHKATKEVYKGMATLYKEHPDFIRQLEPFHPGLAAFMSNAMEFFANENL